MTSKFAPITHSGVGSLAGIFTEMGRDAVPFTRDNVFTTLNFPHHRKPVKIKVMKFSQMDQTAPETQFTAKERERMSVLLLFFAVTFIQTATMEKTRRTARKSTSRKG